MANVPTLRTISKLASCHVLLDFVEETNPRLTKGILTLLEAGVYSAITEELLECLLQFYAEKLTNELLKAVVPNHLREFKIDKCLPKLTFFGLTEVMKKCPHLHRISLKECDQLMSPGQFVLWRRIGVSITALCLESCHNVTDQVVQSALRHVTTLQHLNVSSCENITEKVFLLNEDLQKEREFTPTHDTVQHYECSLISVDVSGCPGITATAVRHLTSLTGPTLKNVNLSWTSINLIAILSLAGYSLPAIIELVISYYNKSDSQKDPKSDDLYSCLLEFKNTLERAEQKRETTDKIDNENRDEIKTHASIEESPLQTSQVQIDAPFVEQTDFSDGEQNLNNSEENIVHTCTGNPTGHNLPNLGSLTDEVLDGNTNKTEQDLVTCTSTEDCVQLENVELELIVTPESLKLSSSSNSLPDEYKSDLKKELVECNEMTDRKDMICKECASVSDIEVNNGAQCLCQNHSICMPKSSVKNDSVTCSSLKSYDGATNGNLSSFNETYISKYSHEDGILPTKTHMKLKQTDSQSDCLNSLRMYVTNCADDGSFDTSNDTAAGCGEKLQTLTYSEHEPHSNDFQDNAIQHFQSVENSTSTLQTSLEDMSSNLNGLENMKLKDSEEVEGSNSAVVNKLEFGSSNNDDVCNTIKDNHIALQNGQEMEHSISVEETISTDKYKNSKNTEIEDTNSVENATSADSHQQKEMDTANSVDNATSADQQQNTEMEHSNSVEANESAKNQNTLEVNKERIKQTYKPQLISVDVTNRFSTVYEVVGFDCLKEFLRCSPNLQKFGMSWAGLTDEMVIGLTPYFKDLKEISLTDCESVTYGITHIGQACKKLEKVDFNGMHFIKDIFLRPFLMNSDLQCLYLAESDITDGTLFRLSARKMDKFQELDLSWCDEVTVQGLNSLCRKSSSLTKLSFRHCPATSLTLSLMAENLKQLQSLNICSVDSITDASVVYLVENLPLLQEIDIGWNSGLSDVCVKALLRSCIYLKKAVLSGLKYLTSAPFLPIISDLQKFRRCQALLRFKLQERKILEENAEDHYSSDEEYEELCVPHRSTTYAPSLQILELEYCDCVDDDHLAEIVAVCRGSLYIVDYFREAIKPVLIHAQKGKVYLSPQ